MTESRLPLIATALYGLSLVVLIAIPLFLILVIFVPALDVFDLSNWTRFAREDWAATTWIGLLASFVPMVFTWLAVNAMRRLFALYRRGDPLAPQAAPLIKTIGSNLLIASILGIVMVPVRTGLMSFQNPVGEREISVVLNSSTVGLALLAGLLLLIGWSMSEAHKAVAENKEFI